MTERTTDPSSGDELDALLRTVTQSRPEPTVIPGLAERAMHLAMAQISTAELLKRRATRRQRIMEITAIIATILIGTLAGVGVRYLMNAAETSSSDAATTGTDTSQYVYSAILSQPMLALLVVLGTVVAVVLWRALSGDEPAVEFGPAGLLV